MPLFVDYVTCRLPRRPESAPPAERNLSVSDSSAVQFVIWGVIPKSAGVLCGPEVPGL